MNKKIVIIGLSNNAKLAAYYFKKDTGYEVVGFAVDKKFKITESYYNLPVFELEALTTIFPPSSCDAFVAVGYNEMNEIRENLYHRLKVLGYHLPNYISPKCSFLTEEIIGDNNLILEDNTIQPFVKIGSNNVFWSGNHIGHDVIIGDHNFITSHVVISGFTEIKNNCFIGVNATIAAAAIILKSTNQADVFLPAKTILYDKKSNEIKIS
jgi:sugar O-acyltransferase (sialic acid O-acetyltransferase NeuD family)